MKVLSLLECLLLILILQATWCIANQSTNNEGVHPLPQHQGRDLQASAIGGTDERKDERSISFSQKTGHGGGKGGRASAGGGSSAARPHTKSNNAQPAAQPWIPILAQIIANSIIVSIFIY